MTAALLVLWEGILEKHTNAVVRNQAETYEDCEEEVQVGKGT